MYRFIPPLIVLVPHDSNVALYACCICHCSTYGYFRQDYGFDPLCGCHQLLVFLKYSVHLNLLV